MREPTNIATVWISLLRADRPLTYREVGEALPEMSMNHRSVSLHTAHRLGYIERQGKRRDYRYCVTPRCTVPPGVPIVEILEATS